MARITSRLFRRLPRRSDITVLSRDVLGHSPAGNRSAPAGEIHAPACRLVETSLAGPEGMGGQKRSVGVLRQELIFSRQESCLKSVVQAERVQLFRQASFLREKNRFSRTPQRRVARPSPPAPAHRCSMCEALHARPSETPRNDARCKKQRRSQFHVKNMHGTGFSVGWIPLTQRYSSKRSRSRM